jgi:hypothetical protein
MSKTREIDKNMVCSIGRALTEALLCYCILIPFSLADIFGIAENNTFVRVSGYNGLA